MGIHISAGGVPVQRGRMKRWEDGICNEGLLLVQLLCACQVMLVSLRDRIDDASRPEGSMSLCGYFGTAAWEKLRIINGWNHDRLGGRPARLSQDVVGQHGTTYVGLRIFWPSPLAYSPDHTAYKLLPPMHMDDLGEPLHFPSGTNDVSQLSDSIGGKVRRCWGLEASLLKMNARRASGLSSLLLIPFWPAVSTVLYLFGWRR